MTLPYVARSGCIDRYSCMFVPSYEAMNNKQLCNVYYTGSGGQHAKKNLYALFDENSNITVHYGDVFS